MVAPDKNPGDEGIATEIFAKVNALKDKAKEDGHPYPFEYEPEKDKYCFLLPKVYKYNGGNNDKLENLLTTNCEDFTNSNFNIEQQMLINERLYSFPDNSKRGKIQEAYITLNDGKEHTNSEINDAILCTRDPDEC